MGFNEYFGVIPAIDRIRDKEAAEKQNFRHQEQPHPQLASIELLLSRLEVVRHMGNCPPCADALLGCDQG